MATTVRQLGEAECRALLAEGDVGRIAIVVDGEPHLFPVNYALVDESIILRTSASSVLGRQAPGSPAAVEVDVLDHRARSGWSVQARGRLSVIVDARFLAHIRRVWQPEPWAAGDRSRFLRLSITALTGRRVGEEAAEPRPWGGPPIGERGRDPLVP